MRKVWIVVANSTYSKIYHAENTQKIIELRSFEHREGHMKASQLVSDSQGRNTNTAIYGYGSDSMEDKTSLKTKESMIFAHQIIAYIEEGIKKGECERLYLIASPVFLGHLREVLTPQLAKLVHTEINKDLTQLTPEQIREYLPPVL